MTDDAPRKKSENRQRQSQIKIPATAEEFNAAAAKPAHERTVYSMHRGEGPRRIFGTDPMGDTITAMTEWDEIGLLTRGEKPLYHLQLCPDAKYPVTDEQWKRMAAIVLEEIGAK